ncbi:hypothetical protein CVT26_014034 [Gymnopilus dilepis]|uniref:Major facilitator superfamily (MFS) profile domain-containing protein n=1 Tax=Gymnopilus dilepis TaxID=231916 RepID=A0A409VU90_9AGAR|nr:hypothetical protein CVT26_014034 [Gymnopilus dilepis]
MMRPSPQRTYSDSSVRTEDEKACMSVGVENTGNDRQASDRANAKEKKDEALDLLSTQGRPSHFISAKEDALLVRKIDRHLMPMMFCIYFLQYLDKQTLAFTSVFGIASEADLTGDDYSLLGSIVYIAQLALQPLSAYFLVKFRLSIYVPSIVTAWGIALACSGAAKNFLGLLFGRFFLGAFEASLQASFILIVQIWYRRHEQGFRLACFYSTTGWTNILGPLFVYGIGHIKSNVVYPYQLVYIILGGITFLVGLLSSVHLIWQFRDTDSSAFRFSIFPDNAVRCKFLTTEEKVMAVERLRANQQGLETKSFKMKQVIEMIFDLKSWCWATIEFAAATASGGWITFAPLILKSFGYSSDRVMLLMVPYGVIMVVVIWVGFWLNRRFSLKSLILIGALLLCITALVILLKAGRSADDLPLLLFAYYLMPAFQLINTTIVNWQASNVAGHTKKSATTAATMMGLFAGNIVGPLLFSSKDMPYYRKGIVAMLICYGTCGVLVLLTVAYLAYLNKWNEGRRVRKGKGKSTVHHNIRPLTHFVSVRTWAAACIVDYSMISAANVEELHLTSNPTPGAAETGRRAFDDLTDLENEEFIVS